MPAAPGDDDLHRLIGELLDVPPAEQHAWLLRRVPHDAALRARLAEVVAPAPETSTPSSGVGFGLRHPTTVEIPIPDRIGHYEGLRLLGAGGMGHVFLAHDPDMRRQVAIKVLARSSDPDFRLRFMREARAVGGLSHANLVTVHHVGEHDGVPFLVMEYVAGRTLQQLIAEPSPPSLAERIALVEQVCSGLDCVHRAGIVHRDVKPGNVIVDRNGVVKLLDFGISKPLGETSALTTSPLVIGTSGYMSPEQAAAGQVDARSDVYSTAVLALELLTLRKPFTGQETRLPETLGRVIAKGMAALPQNRFQTIGEMQRAFAQARIELLDASAAPLLRNLESTASRRPGRSAVVLSVAITLGVLLIAGVWFVTRRPAEENVGRTESTPPAVTRSERAEAIATFRSPEPPSTQTARPAPGEPVRVQTTLAAVDDRGTASEPAPRIASRTTSEEPAPEPPESAPTETRNLEDARTADAPALSVAPPPAAAPEVAATEAISRALGAFEQAFASLSTPALRRSYPGLTRAELVAWERVFLDSTSYDLRFSNRRIQLLSPTRARVDAIVRRTVVPRQGEVRRLTGIVAIALEREDTEWWITSMTGAGWP